MNRLGFLVVITILSQMTLAVPKRFPHHRGYNYDGEPDFFNNHNNPWFHNGGDNNPEYHEAYGGDPERYGSYEDDFDNSRSRPDGPYGGGWWRPTTSTTQQPVEPQYPNRPFLALCIKTCPVSAEYNPVCGSNDVTYQNPSRLECERNCGVAVSLKNLGPCSHPGPVGPPPAGNQAFTGCMRTCPVSSEFNPVCGSDRVTYSNPGRLECAQRCSSTVTLANKGACSNAPVEVTTSTENVLVNIIATCMKSCPVTSEFNPVCGTNNVTYSNPGRLECAQNCGVQVQLGRKLACGAPLTAEEKKDEDTESGTETIIVPTTTTPYVNSNGDPNTISGNNDIENWALNNSSIEINNQTDSDSKEGENQTSHTTDTIEDTTGNKFGNSSERDSNEETEPKARPNKDNNCNSGNRKNPSVTEVMECMQTCTLTSESNPVCGTDNITYMNPGRLLCAQFCGVDVRLKKFAPCNSTSITNVHCLTPCTNPPLNDEMDPGSTVESCMKACPASMEFKPVCGSNNVTYSNSERLQCARRCGIDVSFKKQAPCSVEVSPNPTSTVQDCIQQCYIPHKYEPICGSDNVTYNNTGHLICTRQCGSDVEVKHFSACKNDSSNETSSTTSTTTEQVPTVTPVPATITTEPNRLNFTIDPSILANIWSELANTTSVPPSNDDDEDLELDDRIKE